MRPDLGRLDAIAEILQVGSLLKAVHWRDGHRWAARARLASTSRRWYKPAGWNGAFAECALRGTPPMKIFRAAALIALLAGPAYAQMPDINIIPEARSKTPEEIEQDQLNEKAYKESLHKIPDAKVSSDPWGTVRSTDAPKPAKTIQTKPRAKTGNASN
jgi:hypothetical protein